MTKRSSIRMIVAASAGRWWRPGADAGVVFFRLGPFGNDNHIQVIQYIYQHHALPLSTFANQAYHPPLYHLLAACLLPFGVKAVQALSLVFSLATLALGEWLLGRPDWLDERVRPWCVGLLALHPN